MSPTRNPVAIHEPPPPLIIVLVDVVMLARAGEPLVSVIVRAVAQVPRIVASKMSSIRPSDSSEVYVPLVFCDPCRPRDIIPSDRTSFDSVVLLVSRPPAPPAVRRTFQEVVPEALMVPSA